MEKNRNDLQIKLQNNSGISSFRNYLHKNEIRANSTNKNKNKNMMTNTSKRKTSHKKFLNNLFCNFKGEKQKLGKYYSKIDTGGIKRKLTDKKLRKDDKGPKFIKNHEIYKNKKYFETRRLSSEWGKDEDNEKENTFENNINKDNDKEESNILDLNVNYEEKGKENNLNNSNLKISKRNSFKNPNYDFDSFFEEDNNKSQNKINILYTDNNSNSKNKTRN